MDLKEGMLFAGNVVDGRVHELGGWMLRIQHMMQQNVEVGQAVSTGPGGSRVGQEYDQIIHTVPPFYKHHEEPEQYLATCYQNALSLAISRTGSGESVRIACPLIESGSREFPTDMAIRIAAKESIQWRDVKGRKDDTLAFGIPDESVASSLIEAIEQEEKNG
jgi:O-acetyl-ADP-ribose deacetylase (regulator of RNase III)